jgi:hypothetical protein
MAAVAGLDSKKIGERIRGTKQRHRLGQRLGEAGHAR